MPVADSFAVAGRLSRPFLPLLPQSTIVLASAKLPGMKVKLVAFRLLVAYATGFRVAAGLSWALSAYIAGRVSPDCEPKPELLEQISNATN